MKTKEKQAIRDRVAEKFDKTLKKAESLKPEKFNYSTYVADEDLEKGCGTVCCLLGWYPKWFPKAGLTYRINDDADSVDLVPEKGSAMFIDNITAKYHECSGSIIDAVFYGCKLYGTTGKLVVDDISITDPKAASLVNVTTRLRKIINAIRSGRLDNHIIYDEE